MPRIRKPHTAGTPNKLQSCFTLLLSGSSGECLAGELGCCGDSCCSSAVVSRALAEYCQHSDAAREAFTAAKGIEAMQVALTRGSAAVATAAARVLGALCGSAHGLRCVLQWQRSSGRDLLSLLASAAGRPGLPPELRAECVDALRIALASLHGPAAGGGMELAGLLQAHPLASEWTTAGAAIPAAASTGQHHPRQQPSSATGWADVAGGASGDMLTSLALRTLLSSNLHLRAAAARLIAAAADEGLLLTSGRGGGAAAASIAAALGLAVRCVDDRFCTTVESTQGRSRTASFDVDVVAEAVADDGPAHVGDGGRDAGAAAATAAGFVTTTPAAEAVAAPAAAAGAGLQQCRVMAAAATAVAGEAAGGGAGPPPTCRGGRLLALCELVVALLSGGQASWELLAALRGPETVLQLCREAAVMQMGSRPAPHGEPRAEHGGGTARSGVGAAEWEALLDAVLLCLREAPRKPWPTVVNVEGAARQRAFAVGAADLAGELARVATGEAAAAAHAWAGACGEERPGDAVGAGDGYAGGGSCDGSWRAGAGAATSLANSLAEWPGVVLLHPDVSPAVKNLLRRVCDLVASLQRQYEYEYAQGTDHSRAVAKAVAEASPSLSIGPVALGPRPTAHPPTASPPWRQAPPAPARPSGHQEAAALRVLAEAAAAAVRLYGALYGREDPAPADGEAAQVSKAEPDGSRNTIGASGFVDRPGIKPSSGASRDEGDSSLGCSEEAVVRLAQCLQRMATYVLDRPRVTRLALSLLGPPLAALADGNAPGAPLAALLEVLGACGDADRRRGLARSLACAAAALAGAMLPSATSGAQSGREGTWACPGVGYRRPNVAWDDDLRGYGVPSCAAAIGSTGTGAAAAAAGVLAAAGDGAFHAGEGPSPRTPRPLEELGAEEQDALFWALRVWTTLMATNRMCTCAVVVRRSGPHDPTSEAGVGAGAAPIASCVACEVRLAVPLAEITEAAERLWAQSRMPVDGSICAVAQEAAVQATGLGTGCAAIGTAEDQERFDMRPGANFRADGCAGWTPTAFPTYDTGGAHMRLYDSRFCDGPVSSGADPHVPEVAGRAHLNSRRGLVLGALMNALAAASDLSHPSTCPGLGEVLMQRMQRLKQAYPAAEGCPVNPTRPSPDHRWFAEGRRSAALQGGEAGVEDACGGAQSLAAEGLAEAEAILDDCLACVATPGSAV